MKGLLIALAILRGADGASTVWNIRDGLQEANPLLPRHPAAIVSVASAWTVGQSVAFLYLERRKPGLGKGLAIVAIVAEGTAIAMNVHAPAHAPRR